MIPDLVSMLSDLGSTLPGLGRPVVVALVVAVLVHVASFLVVSRVRAADAGPVADPGRYVDDRAGTVRCPSCRAENDLGYRFCRECLGELPGAIDRSKAPSSPFRTAG